MMVSIAAAIHHDAQNHKDDDCNDFQQTEPILELCYKEVSELVTAAVQGY